VSVRRIGLDVGGVIIDAINNDSTDTAFRSDNFMATTPVKGAREAVKTLVETFGRENIFVVSKCGEVTEGKTKLWLKGTDFYSFTGFDPANLFFCRERADKAPIAAKLQLTDFVDDRADVLAYMEDIVTWRYLFGPQSSRVPGVTGLILAETWSETLSSILQGKMSQSPSN
jgi:hypothetical protein